MSALAKALLGMHERIMEQNHHGDVWLDEKQWDKLVELARREAKPTCTRHGIEDCLVCRKEGRR